MKNGMARSGEAVDRREQVLVQRRQRNVHEEHERDRHRGQQDHEDREAEQQQRDRNHRQGERHGLASTGGSGVRRAECNSLHTAKMSINPKPSATMPCGIHIGTPAMSLVRPSRSICRA